MADIRNLEEALDEVAKQGAKLTSYLSENSYYQPSFEQGGFKEYPELPEEHETSRRRLLDAAKAVAALAYGPDQYVKDLAWSVGTTPTGADSLYPF